jgi:hypothetical protein
MPTSAKAARIANKGPLPLLGVCFSLGAGTGKREFKSYVQNSQERHG